MKISGVITKVYEYDFALGDCIIDVSSNNEVIRCCGCMGRFQSGHPVIIEGEYENSGYSKQFVISHIAMDYSNTAALKQLVREYDELPHEIDVETIKKLDKKIINILYAPQLEQNLYDEYSSELGFPKIRRMISKGVYDIPENPYESYELYGFRFADKIAAKRGISPLNKTRLNALVNAAIDRIAENGDTYISVEQLSAEINILQQAFPPLDSRYILMNSRISKKYVPTGNGYAHQQRIFAEKNVARQIARLAMTAKNLNFKPEMVDEIQKETGIKYAPQQRSAFDMCTSTGLKILTGGPGTGKTSTLKGILNVLKRLMPNAIIKCCAPTGRAAQRMKESTELEAQTVHRLCEYRPFNGESYTSKNEADPIDADIIVVDEVSMLDINLASMLMSAVKDGTFVLLVGDINQLESVGPGSVLRDIIASGQVPVYMLTKIFRQAEDSQIVSNANKVRDGIKELQSADDFKIIRCANEEDVSTEAMRLFKKYYDTDKPYDFQILSPIKASLAGVNRINEVAQEYIYSDCKAEHITVNRKKYYAGDKIIFLENDVEAGFYNGDCGIITEIHKDEIVINIPDGYITISKEDFGCITLAYDITIHKSQGSEYPVVTIPLVKKTPGMLTRNLLYTAITRAKVMVYIITENDAMEMCINNATAGRKTGLVSEILSAFLL